MPSITRENVLAARHPTRCPWSADQLWEAISARFPGEESIDLQALCESWATDDTLSHDVRLAAVQLADVLVRNAGYVCTNPVGYFSHPRERMQWFANYLEAHPDPTPATPTE